MNCSDKKLELFKIIKINNSNLNSLNNIFFNCDRKYIGFILYVEKNNIDFEKLFFLKPLIYRIYSENKKVALIGLPYCVKQALFGSFDFLRIENILEDINIYFFRDFKENLLFRSSQVLECKNCILYNNCEGLGLRKENLKFYEYYRIKSSIRSEKSLKIVFKDIKFNNLFKRFANYLGKSSIYYSDRALRFSRNHILGNKDFSNYIDYENRFIYYARYLPFNELEDEKKFLLKNVHNKELLNLIFDNYKKYLMKGFAYSVAKIDNLNYRESYYIYFQNTQLLYLFLKNENFNFTINDFKFLFPYFIGLDYIVNFKNNLIKLKGYKIYNEVLNYYDFINFLELKIKDREFLSFFIGVLNGSFKEYLLYVERYDESNNLKSIKIEFTPMDNLYMDRILKKFKIRKSKRYLEIEYFAFEFDLEFRLKKITIYERPILLSGK